MKTEFFQQAMKSIQEMDNQSRSQEIYIIELENQVVNLSRVAAALRNNIDVSTINNSKKQANKWIQLASDADSIFRMVKANQDQRNFKANQKS